MWDILGLASSRLSLRFDPALRDCGLDGALGRAHRRLLRDGPEHRSSCSPRGARLTHANDFSPPPPNPAEGERTDSRSSLQNQPEHRRADGAIAAIDEEVFTYQEAARLLKVSPRTLERWTREGLVPYIRLPQRGRWSGVRFFRNQLLRWLRHRTVRAR